MICSYCGRRAKLVAGDVIYPHRPDLARKRFWQCKPCGAYVGCHGNTDKPLGRLANADLRSWKIKAHFALDRHWKHGRMSRHEAYKKLAKALGLLKRECHIGQFDISQCMQTVEVCDKWRRDEA